MENRLPTTISQRPGAAVAWLCLIFLAPLASAQDTDEPQSFTLFETVESSANNSASAANQRANRAAQQSRNTQAAPTFVLIGTSRIGNRSAAMLRHMNGDVIRVPLSGSTTTIPGHELYSVVSHGPEQLAIRYPASTPCTDFPEQGISCNSVTNISTLNLTTASAIAVADVEPQVQPETEETEPEAEQVEVRNPFEAIRQRGRAGSPDQANPNERFQPRRINPDEVPPGMRVVSTPFGDRLVPQ